MQQDILDSVSLLSLLPNLALGALRLIRLTCCAGDAKQRTVSRTQDDVHAVLFQDFINSLRPTAVTSKADEIIVFLV